ncbi:unnamed protein product [Rotaria socialis]|uniref:Uncharacterized protein n=1 Tax=Rotaria socialis TaxID=392032 RepID=A0A817WI92_9BILA|nr:unnamed protein product [Rotaria socialis]
MWRCSTRNAFQPRRILQCHHRFGMNPKLIRSTNQLQIVLDNDQQSLIKNKSEAIPSDSRSLNHLENNNSTLTGKQWTVFSNKIYQYHQKKLHP